MATVKVQKKCSVDSEGSEIWIPILPIEHAPILSRKLGFSSFPNVFQAINKVTNYLVVLVHNSYIVYQECRDLQGSITAQGHRGTSRSLVDQFTGTVRIGYSVVV